jgi:hypothetical protein
LEYYLPLQSGMAFTIPQSHSMHRNQQFAPHTFIQHGRHVSMEHKCEPQQAFQVDA